MDVEKIFRRRLFWLYYRVIRMDDNGKQNFWRFLEQVLARVDTRFVQIETRLSELESQNEPPRTIFSEKRVVEAAGLLGGRELLASSVDNGIVRVTRQPVCDNCGKALRIDEEEFSICHSCGKKLCQECGIRYSNMFYCLDCLRRIVPLTKGSYKVLVAIANEVTRISVISELTKMPRRNVESCLTELLNTNLTMKKGLAIFSKICVTDLGMEAIAAFREVYGSDDDIAQFDLELRKYLTETRSEVNRC